LAKATCGNGDQYLFEDYPSGDACSGSYGNNAAWTKRVFWQIYWLDGHSEEHYVLDSGVNDWDEGFFGGCNACWPSFGTPFFEESGQAQLGSKLLGLEPLLAGIVQLYQLAGVTSLATAAFVTLAQGNRVTASTLMTFVAKTCIGVATLAPASATHRSW